MIDDTISFEKLQKQDPKAYPYEVVCEEFELSPLRFSSPESALQAARLLNQSGSGYQYKVRPRQMRHIATSISGQDL